MEKIYKTRRRGFTIAKWIRFSMDREATSFVLNRGDQNVALTVGEAAALYEVLTELDIHLADPESWSEDEKEKVA